MGFVSRTLKVYFIGICVFLLLTVVQAALLQLTSYKEAWSFYGLVAALGITALFLGLMEGRLIGKRGLPVGILSAILFMIIVLTAVGGLLPGSRTEGGSQDVLFLIPVLSGAVGGILGANSSKS